jgi:phosphoribosylanthranilate isomerase
MSFPFHVPFRIKLCGFRRVEDVEAAIEARADAIGINFCETSPRYILPEKAIQLVETGRGRALMIGVFVNANLAVIRDTLRICPLDMLQLHGDEVPELVREQGLPPIIKAIPWRERNVEDATNAKLWSSQAEAVNLAGILVDAYDPVQRGGTGRVTRWDLLHPRPSELSGQPLILAGGLTAENVGEAIRIGRPDAVDTASGVEVEPGVKDRVKMQRFIAETMKGFESAK